MDLVDVINAGLIAVRDLAPGDRRLAELVQLVHNEGAARFGRALSPTEPVSHVFPVGVPETTVCFGALAIQPSWAGLVWRDAQGVERASVIELGNATRTTSGPVIVGGEAWTRFDLQDRLGRIAFLLPPLGGPAVGNALVALLSRPSQPPVPYPPQPAEASVPVPVAAPRSGVSATVIGFLGGLTVTLVLGLVSLAVFLLR